MKVKSILCIVVTTLFLASCGTKKRVVQNTPKQPEVVVVEDTVETPTSVEEVEVSENASVDFLEKLKKENPRLNKKTLEYIKKFYPIAVSEMHAYKIPASITLAQGILESGNGFSDLATRSNNHFGIKCHRGWTGERVYHDDDEAQECFRKYKHPDTSYKDHSQFLVGRSRYAKLFKLDKHDYKGWAKGLRKAGYATDRKYPQKLIGLIERYQLYKFDSFSKDFQPQAEEIVEETMPTEEATNSFYKVKQGDTLYSIARKHNTSVAKIKELNGLDSNNISIGQKLWVK